MHVLLKGIYLNVSKVARNEKERSYCCSRFWLYGAIKKNISHQEQAAAVQRTANTRCIVGRINSWFVFFYQRLMRNLKAKSLALSPKILSILSSIFLLDSRLEVDFTSVGSCYCMAGQWLNAIKFCIFSRWFNLTSKLSGFWIWQTLASRVSSFWSNQKSIPCLAPR